MRPLPLWKGDATDIVTGAVESASISKRAIEVSFSYFTPRDAKCCPSGPATASVTWNGTDFVVDTLDTLGTPGVIRPRTTRPALRSRRQCSERVREQRLQFIACSRRRSRAWRK